MTRTHRPARLGASIEVRPGAQERKVRLELRCLSSQHQWILRPGDNPITQPRREQRNQTGHHTGVGTPDGAISTDLSLDELDTLVLIEDGRLAHALVFLDGEAAALQLHRHLAFS